MLHIVQPLKIFGAGNRHYLIVCSVMPSKQRRKYLEIWHFTCNCERYEFEKTYQPSPMKSSIETDPTFQYVPRKGMQSNQW